MERSLTNNRATRLLVKVGLCAYSILIIEGIDIDIASSKYRYIRGHAQ